MTVDNLPPLTPFLNSVCPGYPFLDHNVMYSLKDKEFEHGEDELPWALLGCTNAVARLSREYVNIARPPLAPTESSTYVSVPYHVSSVFDQCVRTHKNSDGNIHIGANVNALAKDPSVLVDLNPGCLTSIIDLVSDDSTRDDHKQSSKNPFNKLTSSFNRILRLKPPRRADFASLMRRSDKKERRDIIDEVLTLNADTFHDDLAATSKLLVSTHVLAITIVAIDENGQYNTRDIVSKTPPVPYTDDLEPRNENRSAAASIATGSHSIKEYKRTIAEPLVRLRLRSDVTATALKAFILPAGDAIVVVGTTTGVLVINLNHLDYQLLQVDSAQESTVTALDVISHPNHEMLVVAGYSNGEVALFSAFLEDANDKAEIRDKGENSGSVFTDECATYIVPFDLSPFGERLRRTLVGHCKLSHKPITSITSTVLLVDARGANDTVPWVVAIAGDDGFVRFLDLVLGEKVEPGKEEGKRKDGNEKVGEPGSDGNGFPLDPGKDLDGHVQVSRFTDVISNYFNDGIRDIQFSPDFNFLCVAGKGDLVEIFKMTYYNVNGLLNRPTSLTPSTTQRSRSGTINSMHSGMQPTSINSVTGPGGFGVHSPATTSLSAFGLGPINNLFLAPDRPTRQYPPIIKDVKMVGRLKGHTNTVRRVQFIKEQTAGLVYKIISCGFDGKVILWEFDYLAMTKVKRAPTKRRAPHKRRSLSVKARPIVMSSSPGPRRSGDLHVRSRSITKDELSVPLLSVTSPQNGASLNRILSNVSHESQDHPEAVATLYQSLYSLRVRRHYRAMKRDDSHTTVFHSIVPDKDVPTFEVPLWSVDLSSLIRDGKVEGVHLGTSHLWCYSKAGDVFCYRIDEEWDREKERE